MKPIQTLPTTPSTPPPTSSFKLSEANTEKKTNCSKVQFGKDAIDVDDVDGIVKLAGCVVGDAIGDAIVDLAEGVQDDAIVDLAEGVQDANTDVEDIADSAGGVDNVIADLAGGVGYVDDIAHSAEGVDLAGGVDYVVDISHSDDTFMENPNCPFQENAVLFRAFESDETGLPNNPLYLNAAKQQQKTYYDQQYQVGILALCFQALIGFQADSDIPNHII